MTARRARLGAALAAGLLAAYAVMWTGIGSFGIGRSDFTSTYVGATLLRQGHGGRIYDEALQAPLHAALIRPDTEGNLPFVNAPVAAGLAVPVTLLDLAAAFRLWSLLQLALIGAAVVVALRAAPRVNRSVAALAGTAALAGAGSAYVLFQAQWDGVSALGLAMAYSAWRRDRRGSAGAWIAVTALVAKPHIALGLAAFVVGRRDRRALGGAAAGAAAVGLASLALVGPSGIAGFVGALVTSTGRWHLSTFLGFTGVAGAWLGDGAIAHVAAALGDALALVVAGLLGDAVRRNPGRLEAGLAGAAVLSLLASPHTLGHDLALLAPAAAWTVAAAAGRDRARPSDLALRPRALTAVLWLWIAVNAGALAFLATSSGAAAGQATTLALTLSAACAAAACGVHRPRRPAHDRDAGRDEGAPAAGAARPAGARS